MKFDLPKDNSSIIKVIGVGGGGSNAVNHMYKQGIKGVDFYVCNTDKQALDISPVPNKITLGASLTAGLGAGSVADVGRNAAIETIDEMKDILNRNTKMTFVTAGMGGGTGTGAAPVIAEAAREQDILTVGVVTMPFTFEGRKRKQQAESGIQNLREAVDTLLIINNDKLRELYGNLKLAEAFGHADDVLTTAVKGIAEIITRIGYINVDFEDVKTVMKESGKAIMGMAKANGENRAQKAVENAISSPLLNDSHIKGAKYVLLNITFGSDEISMDEITEITDFIQDEAGATADVIWGYGQDEELGNDISITLIATGFETSGNSDMDYGLRPQKKVIGLEDELPTKQEAPVIPAPVAKMETAEKQPEIFAEESKFDSTEPYLKTEEQPTTSEPEVVNEVEEIVAEEPAFVAPVQEEVTPMEVVAEVEETVEEVEETVAEVAEPEVEAPKRVYTLMDATEEVTSDEIVDEAEAPFIISETEPMAETQFTVAETEEVIESSFETTETDEVEEESSTVQGKIEFAKRHVLDMEEDTTAEPVTSKEEEAIAPYIIKSSGDEAKAMPTSPEPKEAPVREQHEAPAQARVEESFEQMPSQEELMQRAQQRMNNLRELNRRLRVPGGIAELENEPAYKRRQVNLNDTPHSSESQVSRYTLSEEENEDGEKKGRLRGNNSFLHDNVD